MVALELEKNKYYTYLVYQQSIPIKNMKKCTSLNVPNNSTDSSPMTRKLLKTEFELDIWLKF